jgi:hypothetical protein
MVAKVRNLADIGKRRRINKVRNMTQLRKVLFCFALIDLVKLESWLACNLCAFANVLSFNELSPFGCILGLVMKSFQNSYYHK